MVAGPATAARARSSVDRALASGARGHRFESCRARLARGRTLVSDRRAEEIKGPMRRAGILLTLAACGLAACGGATTTKTVTVTRTVTAPASTAPTTTPATGATTPTETTPEDGAASTPLPAGVIAADGTYRMRTRRSDYTGENTAVDDEFPTDSEWIFATTCRGSDCILQMRRELQSGAFKNVTLKPDPARAGVYVAQTSGTTGCANDHTSPTKQRYSVRLTAPADVNGRETAQRMDVYFTEVARGCTLSKVARGVVSWRGNRAA
jgi:hypothetical protein